jgi:thioredoxin 1
MQTLTTLKYEIENEKALLLYFYNDDCAPCLSLRPKVEHLMIHSLPKMKLIFVNSKANAEIPASFGIFSNPTILLFFEGKEYRRFSKFISIQELQQAIERYYRLLFEEE